MQVSKLTDAQIDDWLERSGFATVDAEGYRHATQLGAELSSYLRWEIGEGNGRPARREERDVLTGDREWRGALRRTALSQARGRSPRRWPAVGPADGCLPLDAISSEA